MSFVPNKMDEEQIAFLANEITKSYMTGKNMGSQEEFAREYFTMYQNSMKIIAEEQRKQNNAKQSFQDIINDFGSREESPNSKLFR